MFCDSSVFQNNNETGQCRIIIEVPKFSPCVLHIALRNHLLIRLKLTELIYMFRLAKNSMYLYFLYAGFHVSFSKLFNAENNFSKI